MQEYNQTHIIAASIFMGFALIAAAIFFSDTENPAAKVAALNEQQLLEEKGDPRRDGEQRNVYGNADAEITIVEFSDYECPFCARVHPTIKQIVDESDGKIAWEYRHLPLGSHRNALPGAIAAECVAEHIGGDAFWRFTDTVFQNQRALTPEFLSAEAVALGMDEESYTSCIANEEIEGRVRDDMQAARIFGANGTPHSIIYFADGSSRTIRGALPYTQWNQALSQ